MNRPRENKKLRSEAASTAAAELLVLKQKAIELALANPSKAATLLTLWISERSRPKLKKAG